MTTASRDIVVADPCAQTNPPLVVAALRAGAFGVLDLTDLDPAVVAAAFAGVARRTRAPFAVRLAWTEGAQAGWVTLELPDQVDTVVVTGGPNGFAGLDPSGSPAGTGGGTAMATGGLAARWPGRQLLVEVTSRDEADIALAAGAHGLIAKGCESGGRIGDTEAFVLAQQIAELGVPFWLQGGFGLHTAAAAFAAGAGGVVLDAQLALVRESSLVGAAGNAWWSSPASPRRRGGSHRSRWSAGSTGSDGSARADGSHGPTGPDASQGSDGPTGPDGSHGSDGSARADGSDGSAAAGSGGWRGTSTVEARAAVAAMDGSETRVVGGHRFYVRPDLPAARLADDTPAAEVTARLGTDLHHDLLPLGQDAAVAAGLAEHHVTVAGVVQAVRAAVAAQLVEAAVHPPLAPGTGVATTNGTRYPVVQGPMTRVSDRPELAAAVAEAGGLPFLALALLSGPEVRSLLTRTAELLGDRAWGVGVLGFVPADVRAAQLEVVHELRPPLALIAGGRPSQAQPLDDAGITTYLHVPSPGLLDRFLREGARRFVFEGRECGGHVGPRASLPLWEAQIARLLDLDDAEVARLDVLFAGGIHDARSAAMVAAAAAPLSARGARIGVLMGTAYLFTEEAVGSGAITETFQAMAQSCETTVLLETAPGHATRCVETDYVRAFAARKAELEAAGTPSKAMWAELEALNLGRLRVASKGVARQGNQLVALDADAQRRDGMYMIGQVATLRHERTTIADLHHQVTAGAVDHLAEQVTNLADDIASPAAAAGSAPGLGRVSAGVSGDGGDRGDRGDAVRPLEIAVVGMAGLFPGATDTEQYWANVLGGVDCVTEVPRERWDPGTFYDPDAVTRDAGRKTPSRWGGFLPEVPFDALAYGIPPRSLAAIESVQLLSLEVAARALADAGYLHRPFDRSRTAVIFGAENGNDLGGAYGFRAAYPHFVGPLPPELEEHLPVPTEDSFPGVLTNVIAGRIANRLDLGGANYTVDAACAASLAALDAACKELVTGTSDVVLCGAADVHNGINDYLLFASVHALSPTGRCRTFDAAADGIALGEGVACVVLKRLDDAERDGDRIYAVIEGVGGSSDGRHLGLTAPRKDGQKRAVERALTRAGVAPSTIGLVEAHGTGTVVGDRTELATLTEVFGADPATAPGAAVLGSVKSQIGHTKCAAGLAGLIKTARALHAGVLPPTRNIEQPNDYYDAGASPFRFLDRPRPWPADERRAGLSAFGFGGTNFHAVLRSHADDDRPFHGVALWPAELFLIRGATADAADERLAALQSTVARVLADDPDGSCHRLRDLAWTVSSSGGDAPVQVAVVASDLADLAAKLVAAVAAERCDGVLRAEDLDLAADTLDDPRPTGLHAGPLHPDETGTSGASGPVAAAPGPHTSHLADTDRATDSAGAQANATTTLDASGPADTSRLAGTGRGTDLGGVEADVARWSGHGAGRSGAAGAVDVAEAGAGRACAGGRGGRPVVAFLHPGQGSQRPGMVGDLLVAFPQLQAVLDGADPEWVDRMFPGAAFTADDRAAQVDALTDTRVAQPALGIAALAVTRLLGRLGVEPDLVGGHSYGELVALHTAGVIDAATLLELSRTRGEAMVAAAEALGDDPGAMAAVSLAADELVPRLPDGVVLANHNGPRQAVVAGPTAAIEAFTAALAAEKVGTKRLDVAAAFHCPLVAQASLALARWLDEVEIGEPAIPVWSNASAAPYPTEPDEVRLTLAAQIGRPVRFVDQIEAMYAAGARVFVEAGPGRVLTQLVERILGDRPHVAVAVAGETAQEPGLTRLLVALAQLAVAGVPVDVRPLFDGRAERLDLAALPVAPPGWRVDGHLVRTRDGEPVSGGLQPADRIPEVVMHHGDRSAPAGTEHREDHELGGHHEIPASAAAAGVATGRDGNVLEYLRSMQQIVDAQRAVMLSYLGERSSATDALLARSASGTAAAVAADHVAATNGASGNGHDAAAGAAVAGNGGPVTWSLPALPPVSDLPLSDLPPADLPPIAIDADSIDDDPIDDGHETIQRPSGDELLATILAIVGERTGYPLDMLDPDLDLEADLSIDSIKRIEIIGELADRVGLPGVEAGPDGAGIDETVVEELAQLKTLRAIVTWIDTAAEADASTAGQARGGVGGIGGLDPAALLEAPTPPSAPTSSGGTGEDHEAQVARNVAAIAAQATTRTAGNSALAAAASSTRDTRRGAEEPGVAYTTTVGVASTPTTAADATVGTTSTASDSHRATNPDATSSTRDTTTATGPSPDADRAAHTTRIAGNTATATGPSPEADRAASSVARARRGGKSVTDADRATHATHSTRDTATATGPSPDTDRAAHTDRGADATRIARDTATATGPSSDADRAGRTDRGADATRSTRDTAAATGPSPEADRAASSVARARRSGGRGSAVAAGVGGASAGAGPAGEAVGTGPSVRGTASVQGGRPRAAADEGSGGVERSLVVPGAARRFVLETAMLAPALPVASASGKTFAVVSDPWEGLGELCSRLERAGATVEIVPTHRGTPDQPLPEPVAALLATVDGVVHLGAADPVRPVDARDVFAALQPAIAGRATTLVAAVAPRHRAAAGTASGVPGLLRAVARELPRHHVRAVEVAADQPPGVVARLLADEVLDPAGPASVAYLDGTRTTRRVAKGTSLGSDQPELPFNAGSVIVLTGGARGITARAAVALARATGCRLELLGRSPQPADEDPRTATAPDRPSLRRALIATGELRAPSEIEAACDRIMAAREIRATLHTLSEIGVLATYHAVDVRDGEALGRVLDEIRARHGRIDAIVHGAGVLDDRLARDKTHVGFDRVFATKVDGAGHLLARLADDVRLVVFFGSVSGVFGNRGQVDYSAANDALDELAARFDGVGERRVISIDWGPWAATGMVSPELEREYARRGVGLIDPDEGVRALLAEMATLPGEPAQVVVMRAEPEALDGRPPIAPGTWTPLGVEVAADDEPEPGDGVVSGPGRAEHIGGHITLEDLTERG